MKGWLLDTNVVAALISPSGAPSVKAWAFQTLKVSAATRVDTPDLVVALRRPKPKEALVRDLLKTARSNWRPVNQKVAYIRMTHAFLVRAFLTFSILLLVQIGWPLGQGAIRSHAPPAAKPVSKPGR